MARSAGALFLAIASLFATVAPAYGQSDKLPADAACRTLTPGSAGGAMPRGKSLLVLRYLGTSNYEIDYQGRVLLLDTFYDGKRGPHTRLIGLKADDIQRADAIFIGHPHYDHIADAASIAKRLQSPIFVAPAGRPVLERDQVPANLIHYVSGGETIKMPGYTVMTALAKHSALDRKISAKYAEAAQTTDPATPDDVAYLKQAIAYNPPSDDPVMDIPNHGTIAYVIVFDDGFKVAFRDSPGAVTDGERDLVRRAGGSVDVAILGYNGFGINQTVDVTLTLAETYHPKLFLPAHQDAFIGGIQDVSTTPLFLAFRDKLPGTHGIDPLYRTPVCINTRNGAVFYDSTIAAGK